MSTEGTESAKPQENVPHNAAELLPLLYDDLRYVAAQRLARERPDEALQPTALVHEAWLRLERSPGHLYHNKQHFFRAAAQAMRRILIESARRQRRREQLEGGPRVEASELQQASPVPNEELLQIDELLTELAARHPEAAELVKLRFFVGLTGAQAAEQLGISRSTADRIWRFTRAWLFAHIRAEDAAGFGSLLKNT